MAANTRTVRLLSLLKGLPGHPLHPPMTDGAIGSYTAATVLAAVGAAGIAEQELAKGWWLTLIIALGLAAVTGLVDWLSITRGTPLWRTATTHLIVMVTANALFGLAAIFGHAGYVDGEIGTAALVLALLGFGALTAGGWLGGSVVFVHGMRVLGLPEEPATRAILPDRKGEQ